LVDSVPIAEGAVIVAEDRSGFFIRFEIVALNSSNSELYAVLITESTAQWPVLVTTNPGFIGDALSILTLMCLLRGFGVALAYHVLRRTLEELSAGRHCESGNLELPQGKHRFQ
jgi:hypothetical protein